jgi:glycerol-3-phosphate dehydrogenase
MGRYLIGTTDIRFDEDPGEARCDEDEMTYLLDEVNQLIPQARLTPDDVLFTYSGVRPLPYAPDVEEWEIPRSHVLHDHAPDLPGLVTVVGGKLTTYRQLAQDAVDDILKRLGRKKLRSVTAGLPLPGAVGDLGQARDFLVHTDISPRTADRLVALYGGRSLDVVALTLQDRELLTVLHEGTGALGAELVFAIRHEFARTLTDVLARRMLLAFEPDHGLEVAERAAALLGERLGWDQDRQTAEVAEYRDWLSRLAVPGRARQPAVSDSLADASR